MLSGWYPGQGANDAIVKLIIQAMDDERVKNELSKRIRLELDLQRTKYKGNVQSYESLTSGNVNMQAKMAASGYDVYGKTIIAGNTQANNNNLYKKMKNRIKYGRSPENGYQNRGGFTLG